MPVDIRTDNPLDMEKLTSLYNYYLQWLWSKNNDNDLRATKFAKATLQIISALISDMKEGQLSLRAMSLVYTTIISIVPLFAISFSVLKGLEAHNQIRPFLSNALEPLGDKGVDITDKIIGFVDNIQVGVLGAVGIVILLYTVIGMMHKIEHAFNYVWHVAKDRNIAKRFNDYLSVLLVGPLLIFLSTAMTASARSDYLIEKIASLDILIAIIGTIIPYFILALAFTFLYSFVPNTKVKWKAAFIGGIITALLWKIMGWGFANFVANSSNQTAIYSAFATIIVFMVWIYLVWLVLLFGSNIGFYIQHPEYRKIRHSTLNVQPAHKEALAIEIMVELGNRFYKHKTALDIKLLSEACGQPHKEILDISRNLKSANLIALSNEDDTLTLARPLEHISIYDIITAIRVNDHKSDSKIGRKYLKNVDEILRKTFDSQTLQKLINKS